jgi:twitching motility protein PilI
MESDRHGNPLLILAGLEQRFRAQATGLPMQAEATEYWRGIGFELGGSRLLVPLDRVEEILTVPSLTRVPLTKGWVLGIANVRGNLLPVMDLQGFLAGRPAAITAASRVLVITATDFSTGLLVDRVTGLQQIDVALRASGTPAATAAALQPYVDGGYRVAGEEWAVFDFARLAARKEFMQAAA